MPVRAIQLSVPAISRTLEKNAFLSKVSPLANLFDSPPIIMDNYPYLRRIRLAEVFS